MAKVIQHPEAEHARIKKETTHAAGVINRELESLAKKFPDYIFEVTMDRQEIARKVMYRVVIRTIVKSKEEKTVRTGVQQLLDFVCEQELDLEEYLDKLPARIKVRFDVKCTNNPTLTPVEDLVRTIIYWEKGDKDSSLEVRLNKLYTIELHG